METTFDNQGTATQERSGWKIAILGAFFLAALALLYSFMDKASIKELIWDESSKHYLVSIFITLGVIIAFRLYKEITKH